MPDNKFQIQKDQIAEFKKVQPVYKDFAEVLEEILKKAAQKYARGSIVKARAKTIYSFSEKIIRKGKYIKPLEEITDLCGARIICQFSNQVKRLSEFVRENFEIDEINSLDVKSRLKEGEFGYRSVHYIVTPRKTEILGVRVEGKLRSLKAEIQLRTFNQHIWAGVIHDRIYKTKIKIPSEWKREAARLAALLENADNAFQQMSDTIDQINVNYLPTPNPEKFQNEKEIIKTLINLNGELDDDSAENYLKLAQLYNQVGELQNVIDLLQPKEKEINKIQNHKLKGRIKTEYGIALCYLFKSRVKSQEYVKGTREIDDAILTLETEKETGKLELAKAWFYKGKVLKIDISNGNNIIRDALDTAHKYSRNNPYFYIEFLIADILSNQGSNIDFDLFSTRLQKCISDCNEHIDLGVEVVKSLFGIIKAAIILNNHQLALNTYLKLIDVILSDSVIFSNDFIEDEINTISKIVSFLEKEQSSIKILGQFLLWRKFEDDNSGKFLKSLINDECQIGHEVLIIAGDGIINRYQMQKYTPYIQETLLDFIGTVVSGGTDSGIPGLVGIETDRLKRIREKQFELFGFLPEKLPAGEKRDNNYDVHVTSDDDDFSFYGVLLYWLNILMAGTKKENILLLGFGGGTLSLLEYKMALTLGVKVALLHDSGRAVSELIQDNYWNKNKNLMIIPDDPLTFWALANRNKPTILQKDDINLLAKLIHGFYREISMKWYDPESENINQYKTIMDWDLLDPKLKISNIKQAEFIEHLLKRVNLEIHKTQNPGLFLIDDKFENYELLAQLEHARWNSERLLSGWKVGDKKDVANKISPYIKQWRLLDNNTKNFDFNAISKFPEILKEVGYEIK